MKLLLILLFCSVLSTPDPVDEHKPEPMGEYPSTFEMDTMILEFYEADATSVENSTDDAVTLQPSERSPEKVRNCHCPHREPGSGC